MRVTERRVQISEPVTIAKIRAAFDEIAGNFRQLQRPEEAQPVDSTVELELGHNGAGALIARWEHRPCYADDCDADSVRRLEQGGYFCPDHDWDDFTEDTP